MRPNSLIVSAGDAADVVGRDAALPVGGAGQTDKGVLPGDQVLYLHRVAHGKDVGRAGAHFGVHHNGALCPQLEPGGLCKAGIRHDPHGHYRKVGAEGFAGGEGGGQTPWPLLEGGHAGAEAQLHALPAQVSLHDGRHVAVQGGQDLGRQLHHGDRKAGLHQVFGNFQPNVAAAHHHRALWGALLNEAAQGKGVFHIAQGEHPGAADPRQGRADGLCARRQDQFVVGFGILGAVGQAAHGDRAGFRVNGHRLVAHTRVDAKAPPEALGRLQGQGALFLDRSAHIIGKPAVCIGNIAAALQHYDLGAFVQPAQPCRGGSAAGNAADDDHFHDVQPPCESCAPPLRQSQEKSPARRAEKFRRAPTPGRSDIFTTLTA